MAWITLLLVVYILYVVELFRNPSFSFSLGIGFFGIPVFGLIFGFREFLLPVYETTVFIAVLNATAQFLLAGWILVRVDLFLREHSECKVVGKWTTISGISGSLLIYFTRFSSSYWDTIPIAFAADSPYTRYVVELSNILYPLLLIGATWHLSRLIYYFADEFITVRTDRISKYLPHVLYITTIYIILVLTITRNADLSTAVDVFVLILPTVVSVGASVREYQRYGLEYRPPILKSRISTTLYRLLHNPTFVFPIAGLCIGVTSSLFYGRLGLFGSMDVINYILSLLFGPILFRLVSEFVPKSIFRDFPKNLFE